jgi:hypothetical protein
MSNQITVDILANTKNLVAGVDATNSKLATLNKSVAGVGSAFTGLAAAFGAQIGINFLKDAIKGAYDDQKSFASLADLFGKDIDGIVKKVNEISKKFYIDDGAVAQYFVQLKSAFSSQFDKFVPTVVEASATLALLTGKPLDEVIAAWGKALKDGKLTAQEVQKIGIDLTAEQEKKFNSLKTTAERLEYVLGLVKQKQQEALDNITGWEKLQFLIGRVKDAIGNALIPAIEKLVGWYDKLTPAQQGVVEKLLAFTLGLIALGAAVAPFVYVASSLVKVFIALREAQILAAAAQAILNGAMLLNPFTPLIVAIGLVIAAVILLVKNWDTVVATFKRVGSAIAEGAGNFKDAIVNAFNSVVSYIRNVVGNFTSIGRDIIQGLVNGIRSMASAPIDAVKGIASGLVNSFKSFFRIGSPSKLFTGYGKNIVQGLSNGIDGAQQLAASSMDSLSARIASPSFSFAGAGGAGINVTINAGVGTDPYELGRVVSAALDKYQGVNGRR